MVYERVFGALRRGSNGYGINGDRGIFYHFDAEMTLGEANDIVKLLESSKVGKKGPRNPVIGEKRVYQVNTDTIVEHFVGVSGNRNVPYLRIVADREENFDEALRAIGLSGR